MFYVPEYWTVKKQCVDEMRILKWIFKVSRNDRIIYIFICEQLGIIPIKDNMRWSCWGWHGHVQIRSTSATVIRGELIKINDVRRGWTRF